MIEQLSSIQLPRLALIKNLKFAEPFREDPVITEGKLIDSAVTINKLREQIPMQIPDPFSDEEWELFEYKFGSRSKEDAYFTDLPSDLADELADRKIFGVSYTIIWLVPPDVETIVKVLRKLPLAGLTQEDIWEGYLDRMIVFPPLCLDKHKGQFELGFNFVVQEKYSEFVGD